MRAAGSVLLLLQLVALGPGGARAAAPVPANPHLFMNGADACPDCHAYDGETVEPHEFFIPIPERCWECHSQKVLGRSHPIGVEPGDAAEYIEVPAELPLEDGEVSCGTCHNPHLEFLATTRAYPGQLPAFFQQDGRVEIPWYKTLYLRKSHPDDGFEPLCMACHKDY